MEGKFGWFRLKDATNSLHFDGLSWNLFIRDQSTIEPVTSCKELLSASLDIYSETLVSSAYFSISPSNWSLQIARSLIITKKSHGLSLVPYGAPALTGFDFEKVFEESFTLCNLPSENPKSNLMLIV